MPNTIKLEFDVAQIKQLESLATKFKSGSGNGEDLLQAKKLTEERKKQIALTEEEKVKNQQVTREKRLQAQLNQAAEGSLAKMTAQLNLMKFNAQNSNTYFRENIKTIQSLDAEVKKLNAEMGRHQMNVGNYAGAIKASFVQIGIAVAGITAAYATINRLVGSSITAYAEWEKAQKRLFFATGQNNAQTERFVKTAEKLHQTSLFTKEQIAESITYALSLGRTEQQTNKMLTAAMGLSRVTGKDLHESMVMLNASTEGVTRGLIRYDSRIRSLTPEQLKAGVAIDLLSEKLAKFGSQGLETTEGKIIQFNKSVKELKESFGGFIISAGFSAAIQTMSSMFTNLNNVLNDETLSKLNKFMLIVDPLIAERRASSQRIRENELEIERKTARDYVKINSDKFTNNYNLTQAAIQHLAFLMKQGDAEKVKVFKEAYANELQAQILQANKKQTLTKGEQDKLKEEYDKFEKEYYKLTHNARSNEIRELTLDYNDKIVKAIKYGKDIVVLQEQLRLKILEINKKYDEQDAEQLKKAQKEKYDSMTAPGEGVSTKKLAEEAEKERNKELREQENTAEKVAIAEKKKYEKLKSYLDEYATAASDILSGIGEIFQDEKEQEIKAAGNNKTRLNQIEQEYAQKQKQIAMAQAILKLAQAQAAIIPEFVTNPIKALIDEAVVLAQFGIVMAKINSAKFAEGVIDLQGGIKGKDSILSLLMPGESVMTEKETKKHKPALQAIRENIFDEYIRVNYVIPELTKKANDDINKSTARNMYDGLKLKAELDDYELRRKLNKLDQTNFYLQSIDNKLNKSNIIR